MSRLRVAAITVGILGFFVAGGLYIASLGDTRSLLAQSEVAYFERKIATESAHGPIIPGAGAVEIDETASRSGEAPSS